MTQGFGLQESETDVDELVRRAGGTLSELGAQITEASVPAHLEAGAIVSGLAMEGSAALVRSNGMGYQWQGPYNLSFAEAFGRARHAQANDFPPTLKLCLMLGTYMSERYHGRMYAKAQNLRRSLRAS